MVHTLPPLPFSLDALAPLISKETLEFHYGKHHAAYVANLNKLIPVIEYENLSLEEIIKKAPAGGIFNNAAQIFNHTFYWHCLAPKKGGAPSGTIQGIIEEGFGSFNKFRELFTAAAVSQFGSGWAWLVRDDSGKLAIEATSNAGTPVRENKKPSWPAMCGSMPTISTTGITGRGMSRHSGTWLTGTSWNRTWSWNCQRYRGTLSFK